MTIKAAFSIIVSASRLQGRSISGNLGPSFSNLTRRDIRQLKAIALSDPMFAVDVLNSGHVLPRGLVAAARQSIEGQKGKRVTI